MRIDYIINKLIKDICIAQISLDEGLLEKTDNKYNG